MVIVITSSDVIRLRYLYLIAVTEQIKLSVAIMIAQHPGVFSVMSNIVS